MMKNTGTLSVTTPTDREIVVTRVFNAPRRMVWDAMSKPELIRRWLFGPPGWTMTVCDDDARTGGSFHWAWSGPNGEQLAMRGAYREVVPQERIVRTESFEMGCANQAGEQLCTMTLTEQGGKTHLKLVIAYPSREACDGALASGMDRGMQAGYDRLEEMLSSNA
jgi:uncharacterized protein YndB with AHSA1/START domain